MKLLIGMALMAGWCLAGEAALAADHHRGHRRGRHRGRRRGHCDGHGGRRGSHRDCDDDGPWRRRGGSSGRIGRIDPFDPERAVSALGAPLYGPRWRPGREIGATPAQARWNIPPPPLSKETRAAIKAREDNFRAAVAAYLETYPQFREKLGHIVEGR
jgi:hypothetical protein